MVAHFGQPGAEYGFTRFSNHFGAVVTGVFSPLSLSPYQWTMMETGLLDTDGAAAGSGDSISVVQNLGSGASNYLQDTGQDQPKYHTTKGLYLPPVTGNEVDYGSFTIGSNETWEAEVEMMIPVIASYIQPYGGAYNADIGVSFSGTGSITGFSKSRNTAGTASGVVAGSYFTLRYGYDGTDFYINIDSVEILRQSIDNQGSSRTFDLYSGMKSTATKSCSIKTAKLTIAGTVVQQTDFTTQHHNATSFTPSVGGTVTVSQSGNDPATVVEYPFTRFDGLNSFLEGTYNSALDGGYMFMLYSVVGDGGASGARVFTAAPTGNTGTDSDSALFLYRAGTTTTSQTFLNGAGGNMLVRAGGYAGTGLHEVRLKTGTNKSLLNGASELTDTNSSTLNLQDFTLGSQRSGGVPAAIDVFVHGLFDKDLSAANATLVRNYIGAQRPNLP
jgi:hypothetical protein